MRDSSLLELSLERSIGKPPAERINLPKIGILNKVCLASIDNLPGREACNNIGSMSPLGCQAMNINPPSGGRFSLSTISNSRNQTLIKERVNLRIIR